MASQTKISESDRAVLDLIRHEGSVSVAHLCEILDVTATAIRQRISRLSAAGLIRRVVEKQERGRPVHLYQLTPQGLEAMGENLADLAEALWLEVINISDDEIRDSVINGVLRRLVEKYRDEVTGNTITERLRSIATLFRKRKIPFVVESEGNRSQLRIVGCPYPKLNEHSTEICALEQRLVSELLDAPVALSHCNCQSSGGQCCAFSADAQQQLNQLPVTGLNANQGAELESSPGQ